MELRWIMIPIKWVTIVWMKGWYQPWNLDDYPNTAFPLVSFCHESSLTMMGHFVFSTSFLWFLIASDSSDFVDDDVLSKFGWVFLETSVFLELYTSLQLVWCFIIRFMLHVHKWYKSTRLWLRCCSQKTIQSKTHKHIISIILFSS